jgi:hypothetical protein
MPQLATHKALVDGDLNEAIFWAISFERTCVKPWLRLASWGVCCCSYHPILKMRVMLMIY